MRLHRHDQARHRCDVDATLDEPGCAGHQDDIADDIADAAAWLAGPRASFVTIATIAVNGGWRVG